MTIGDLRKLLSRYGDEQLVLVEASGGGFEDPKVYVSSIRPRKADEFDQPFASEYVASGSGEGAGVIVIGTVRGLLTMPI